MHDPFWVFFAVSATMFVSTTMVLLTGDCAHSSWKLDYISTQLAACLDTLPEVSWVFFLSVQVQVFLLLIAWERLFQSTELLMYFQCVIVSLAGTFMVSLASVIEFRSDRNTASSTFPNITEDTLHESSAVFAIVSFALLHAILGFSLLDLSYFEKIQSRQNKSEEMHIYFLFDKMYVVLVVVFFIAWPLASTKHTDAGLVVAAVSEWMVLVVGAAMHVYALFQVNRPIQLNQICATRSKLFNVFCTLNWMLTFGISCLVFTIAPVGISADTLRTSVFYLIVIISTYTGTGIIMLNRSIYDKSTVLLLAVYTGLGIALSHYSHFVSYTGNVFVLVTYIALGFIMSHRG